MTGVQAGEKEGERIHVARHGGAGVAVQQHAERQRPVAGADVGDDRDRGPGQRRRQQMSGAVVQPLGGEDPVVGGQPSGDRPERHLDLVRVGRCHHRGQGPGQRPDPVDTHSIDRPSQSGERVPEPSQLAFRGDPDDLCARLPKTGGDKRQQGHGRGGAVGRNVDLDKFSPDERFGEDVPEADDRDIARQVSGQGGVKGNDRIDGWRVPDAGQRRGHQPCPGEVRQNRSRFLEAAWSVEWVAWVSPLWRRPGRMGNDSINGRPDNRVEAAASILPDAVRRDGHGATTL